MATYSLANERLRALEDIEREIGAILQNAGSGYEDKRGATACTCADQVGLEGILTGFRGGWGWPWGGAGSRGLALEAGPGAGGWPSVPLLGGRGLGGIEHLLAALHARHGLHVLPPVAHLHGPFLRGPHTETERRPARRKRDWAIGSQPVLEGGAAPALLPPEQGGEPPSPVSQGFWNVLPGGGAPPGALVRVGRTFSVSSFFTDLRLARRSIDTLCLEPSRARSMASAETRTRRSGGRLNFPRKSSTLSFRSLICRERVAQGSGPGPRDARDHHRLMDKHLCSIRCCWHTGGWISDGEQTDVSFGSPVWSLGQGAGHVLLFPLLTSPSR